MQRVDLDQKRGARRSLTAKMLFAVGVTVAIIIAIYTFFVIRVQSTWWHERTLVQNALTASLVHEYLQDVMLSGHHTEVQRFLQDLKNSQEIFRGRVMDVQGRVVFSADAEESKKVTIKLPQELFGGESLLQGQRMDDQHPVMVTIRPVRNESGCRRCHDQSGPFLGAIMLEKSMKPVEAAITQNRNLLIVYGMVILVLVGVVLWLLIVRFVTRPVGDLLQQMQRVETGDLSVRVRPEGNDEICQLARGFDAMVGSLETAQRELQESHDKQLQQASRLASIGELSAGVAHEIRNPLAGIGAAVEVLAEMEGAKGQYVEVVGEIRQQIARLNSTLRNLLDFGRPRDPEIVPCGICELMKPMLGLIRPDAQKSGIQIVEICPSDLPPICVDSQQAQQAMLNILLNAMQAMPQGGTLTVQAELIEWPAVVASLLLPDEPANGRDQIKSRRAMRLTIRDTGMGIPRENLDRVFSPFFTTKHRGTGLGLPITRSIVEKHHGRIYVESEPGKGSAFYLEFPTCKEENCAAYRRSLEQARAEQSPSPELKTAPKTLRD